MKKILFLLLSILSGMVIYAQSNRPCVPCLPQGITFTTQSQIDSFQINYPNCTQIGGTVEINGNMVNLLGLYGVESIGGNLEILSNTFLSNLSGLTSLQSIGSGLYVIHNLALTSLIGLNNLTSIGEGIQIMSNKVLTSLGGLDNLPSIGGSLEISYNNVLTDLSGLNSLISIPGYLLIDNNYAMTNVTGLNNLNLIGGKLDICSNPVLTSLTGLDGVTSIGEGLTITNNDALTSLTGLDNIESGSIDDLDIIGNGSLSNCAVQSICDYLGYLSGPADIYYNAMGCNSVEEVKDSCGITAIEQVVPESSLIIYPNPTSTTITINTPAKCSLSIQNISGQQLLQQQITEPTSTLDVSGLSTGVYMLKVVGKESVQVGKFVKK